MCLAQGPQRSDFGEAQTRGPSVSGQVLYHRARATALPTRMVPEIICRKLELILKKKSAEDKKT